MVSRYHHRLYTCFLASADGLFCFLTRRVDHTDHSKEYEVFLDCGWSKCNRQFRYGLISDSKDTKGLRCHFHIGLVDILNIFFCERSDRYSIIYPGTICEQFVESSFDSDKEVVIIILMDGCHQFSFGIERNLSDSWQGFFERVLVYQISDTCIYQCSLSRISYGLTVSAEYRIVCEHRHLQEFIDDRAIFCGIRKISCSIDVGHSHLVLSQCTCLVGADYSRASKCLYRRKIADNGILLSKSLNAKGEDNSGYCR